MAFSALGLLIQKLKALKFTLGRLFTIKTPMAKELAQLVAESVISTWYTPGIFDLKLFTLPGSITPAGQVHLYKYVPVCNGVAIIVAVLPAQMLGLFTSTLGNGLTVMLPVVLRLLHFVRVSVIITL